MGKAECLIVGFVVGVASLLGFAGTAHYFEEQGCERTLMVDECEYVMGHWQAAP